MKSTNIVLCFDFGLARIGVAVSDMETQIVHPLTTIHCPNKQPDYEQIDKLIEQWNPKEVVVGYPSNQSPSQLIDGINRFIKYIAQLALPVSKMDEAYSSFAAKNLLKQQRQNNLRSKIKKSDVDKTAACFILESWLAYTTNQTGINKVDIQIDQLIENMVDDLQALIVDRGLDNPVIIGIRTGGAWIAERLYQALEIEEELSTLDINFYRDDFSRIGLSPHVKPSIINSDIDNRHIILVDDVLHTGRTICAALNEISDYGRAATISLAVLIDRQGRELPVCADVCGTELDLAPGQQVKLRGPDSLSIEVIDLSKT